MKKAEIKKRIDLAADYLTRQIQPTGKFIYQRDSQGKIKKGKYNMLRHAGTIWALDSYKQLTGNSIRKLEVARRYLIDQVDDYVLVNCNGSYKAGANALAILALNEYHQNHQIDRYSLLKGLRNFVWSDSQAYVYKYSKLERDTMMPLPFESEYYPGEVALALVTMGEYYKALTLMVTTLKGRQNPIHDHWMIQAICKYLSLEVKLEEGFLRNQLHIMVDVIIREPELYIERSTPTACRLEALIPYNKLLGYNSLIGKHIETLVENLLKWQCLDKNHPAYGAFIDNDKYQIDYTQHALSALIAYYNTL